MRNSASVLPQFAGFTCLPNHLSRQLTYRAVSGNLCQFMDPKHVPARIKRLREDLDLNQLKFGAAINVRPETISRWENGKTEPSLADMVLIADTFKISLDWFAGVDQTPDQRTANVAERAEQAVRAMQRSLDQLLADLAAARVSVARFDDAQTVRGADIAGVGKQRSKKGGKAIAVPRESAG